MFGVNKGPPRLSGRAHSLGVAPTNADHRTTRRGRTLPQAKGLQSEIHLHHGRTTRFEARFVFAATPCMPRTLALYTEPYGSVYDDPT